MTQHDRRTFRAGPRAATDRRDLAGLLVIFVTAWALMPGQASSHREAPLTAQDWAAVSSSSPAIFGCLPASAGRDR